jgi:hypothetical protein
VEPIRESVEEFIRRYGVFKVLAVAAVLVGVLLAGVFGGLFPPE